MNLTRFANGFSSTFWVANTLELFERLAFYGSKAVLLIFLLKKVGLEDAGKLTGMYTGLVFALPIVAGVFVDRYGFKKTLIACFAIFGIGYFLIGLAGMEFSQEMIGVIGKKNYVMAVLILTACGGSLIKPCIVGTVSRTTTPENRPIGFSIYYTLVNLGGTLGPMLALPIRENVGIEYVLIMSSVTSFLLCIGAWIFFKEPPGVEEPKTFGIVLRDMLLVFGNIPFISFLVIFSGFWLMFWQIFLLLPVYGTDVLNFSRFEILESIGPFCIILLTVPMAALVRKWKPITAMTLGFILASMSWLIIGTWPTVTATIIGLALFAVGEATQAPRFYDYVSSLAPRDQVGTFMGFAFLPVAIGAFTAGFIADWLRVTYLQTDPSTMWYIVAGIGLVSTILMMLYNVFISRHVKPA